MIGDVSFDETSHRSIVDAYRAHNPVSGELYMRERSVIPGGSTRGAAFYQPFPVYVHRGDGCRIVDVDGNERIDFMGNYSTLILGHAHPAIVAAVGQQIQRSSVYGAPSASEVELAELLVERFPSVERVVFTTTGSEAVLAALRAARAYTGRTLIGKFEGGYHGSYDWVKFSSKPDPRIAGPARRPHAVFDSEGIPASVGEQVCVMQFNDVESVREVLDSHGNEMAAVIVEPVLGSSGMIPALEEFLRYLRDATADRGVVLIFDEIITQRLGSAGAQGWFGVAPDLSIFAKCIGGGFPIGAVAGRKELLDVFDNSELRARVYHSGTFNANAVSLAAGLATLRELTPAVYEHINRLGDECRRRLTELFSYVSAPVQAVGIGSLFHLHATTAEVRNYRSARTTDAGLQRALFLALLNRGIYLAARGMGCISAPMTDAEVVALVTATESALAELGYEN